MKLIRIEEVNYRVLYIEDEGHFSAYKKSDKKWEKYITDWRILKDEDLISKLEDILKQQNKNNI